MSDEKKDATKKEAADLWKEMSCSFCGRKPFDVQQMIERRGARICNFCVAEFKTRLKSKPKAKKD
jgi:hypothetical protein